MLTKLGVLSRKHNVSLIWTFQDSNLRPHEGGASTVPLSYPNIDKFEVGPFLEW